MEFFSSRNAGFILFLESWYTFFMTWDFYKNKSLFEMSDEEWEALCDGCGKCCYRKFIEGRGKNSKLFFTRIACNFLDLKTGLCSEYENRFKLNKECTHLTKKMESVPSLWLRKNWSICGKKIFRRARIRFRV